MSKATLHELRRMPVSEEFERIFREHSQLIYRTAYGITGNIEDAQDVLQTIFLRLLRREMLGRERAREEVGEEECLTLPASTESERADEIHERLYEAIAQLPPEAAHILILRYLHNYSDADIAKMLGTSRTVIAVRLFRVRARLKQLIESLLGESK